MLTYKKLKNHAGLLLVGDYQTLESLHSVIHEVNERSIVVRDKEGWFLGLAYDLRKAYEGQRKILRPPTDETKIGPRFGVEILWPVLLVQSRMLRNSLAFIDSSKHMQAHAYALEAVIENALVDDFGGDLGAELIERWERIDPRHSFPEEALKSRGAVYCAWSKTQRKQGVSGLLGSLNPMYSFLYKHWAAQGAVGLVSPEEYAEWANVEWPDPKW